MPSPDAAAVNAPDHETLPCTIVFVSPFHVLLAVSIHGGELFAPDPFGTEHTKTVPAAAVVVLYFESPSGSAAQFSVPEDVAAAGHE